MLTDGGRCQPVSALRKLSFPDTQTAVTIGLFIRNRWSLSNERACPTVELFWESTKLTWKIREMLPFLAFSLPFRNSGYSPNCRDQLRSRRLLICLKVYLWWGLCTLCLLAYQVRVTLGYSGLDCCVYVVFWELINSLVCQMLTC